MLGLEPSGISSRAIMGAMPVLIRADPLACLGIRAEPKFDMRIKDTPLFDMTIEDAALFDMRIKDKSCP